MHHSMNNVVMVRLKILRGKRNTSIELVPLYEFRLFLNSMSIKHKILDGIKQVQVGAAKIEGIKVVS